MGEIIFLVEEDIESGYISRALGEDIFVEAETMDDLKREIKDAVRCHFDQENMPDIIRLHFVRDEVVTL